VEVLVAASFSNQQEKYMKISGITEALFVLISIAISGCLSGSNAPPANLSGPQEKAEAGVTVTAKYLGDYAFQIKMDTHSGSLDYEMANVSYIRDGKGNIIKPEVWDGGIGGHHLSGTLKFPKFNDSAGFELVIENVAGVKERVFNW
jgi:hypothetical protein